MELEVGDRLPEINLTSLDGQEYDRPRLMEQPSLFILLRHLG